MTGGLTAGCNSGSGTSSSDGGNSGGRSGCGGGGGDGGITGGVAGGSAAGSGGCPVHRGGDAGALNPANAMPIMPAQEPAPGQRAPLSTQRVTSTIPSGEAKEPLWVYPSEQMFFNAMRRKGYSPREEEMSAVIAIHNSVNERAWSEVLEWERALHPECVEGLRLLRFMGKPDEPTLKAQARAALGYARPFDRHDWVVQRCGAEVTYLIDFYNGRPTRAKPVAMHIDARPAGTDLQGVWDRLRRPFVHMWRAWQPEAPSAATTATQAAAQTAASTPAPTTTRG